MSSRVPGSYRDPAGFLYFSDNTLHRQINPAGMGGYNALIDSGLYAELTAARLLIDHEDAELDAAFNSEAAKVIRPRRLETITYPYEWSFSQLKDAALLTLNLQQRALAHDLCLKDASGYNVQFDQGQPVFIDTLSFDTYIADKPWAAYGQFCRHFLAPLALMAYTDIRLNQLLRTNIDGIPLPLCTKLLPRKTAFKPSLAMHLWLHAKSDNNAQRERDSERKTAGAFSRNAFMGLLDSLRSAVNGLEWKPGGTEWFDYYEANNNYGDAGLEAKETLVSEYLDLIDPASLWDLGGNTGRFSRLASNKGIHTVCFDIDPGCVESNYLHTRKHQEQNLLPLLTDLGNPSPGLGWANTERMSLTERGPVDALLALGLIHHLAIGLNVPFTEIADLFSRLGKSLIIEFVPRGDSQIDKLLSTRTDKFDDYQEETFVAVFSQFFDVVKQTAIPGTKRTLYAMRIKPGTSND